MNQKITDRLTLFTQNVDAMRRGFTWHHTGTKRLAALLYALEGKAIDCEALKESLSVIQKRKGVFSMFRGNMSLFIAAMLSLDEGCQKRLDEVSIVYDMLKVVRFRPSDYTAVAAYLIVTDTDMSNYQNTVERARAFYDGMKKNNRLHTGEDDYIFAVMLGLSDIDVEEGVQRVDELYRKLRADFRSAGGGSIQALSQMLTLGGKSNEALGHLLLLRTNLRARRVRLDKTYTLPALGAMSLLPVEGEVLVKDIIAAQDHLRGQRGFGRFTVSTQEILLFSSAVISSVYAKDMSDKVIAATSVSIVNIIIAQQVAMIVAASAAAAASA